MWSASISTWFTSPQSTTKIPLKQKSSTIQLMSSQASNLIRGFSSSWMNVMTCLLHRELDFTTLKSRTNWAWSTSLLILTNGQESLAWLVHFQRQHSGRQRKCRCISLKYHRCDHMVENLTVLKRLLLLKTLKGLSQPLVQLSRTTTYCIKTLLCLLKQMTNRRSYLRIQSSTKLCKLSLFRERWSNLLLLMTEANTLWYPCTSKLCWVVTSLLYVQD